MTWLLEHLLIEKCKRDSENILVCLENWESFRISTWCTLSSCSVGMAHFCSPCGPSPWTKVDFRNFGASNQLAENRKLETHKWGMQHPECCRVASRHDFHQTHLQEGHQRHPFRVCTSLIIKSYMIKGNYETISEWFNSTYCPQSPLIHGPDFLGHFHCWRKNCVVLGFSILLCHEPRWSGQVLFDVPIPCYSWSYPLVSHWHVWKIPSIWSRRVYVPFELSNKTYMI